MGSALNPDPTVHINGQVFSNFLLVSSNGNSSIKKSGAVGKSFQPLQGNGFEMEKAPSLPLDMDIVNLQVLYKNLSIQLKVCESTMHKKSLKKRSQILDEIKQLFSSNIKWWCFFYFTGHGYPNGDLCIETLENPEGERLTIEEILDIMIGTNPRYLTFFIIDACYSGRNIERIKEHLLKRNFCGMAWLQCSSGPQYTSIVTQVGSLLIAKHCRSSNKRIQENQKELGMRFQARRPIWLIYYRKSGQPANIQIKDMKF